MPTESAVSEHYSHGNLLNAITDSITKLGKTTQNITIEDLAAVDEFHIGGREATKNFLGQIKISKQDHVLDVGCGLGGAARFVADKYNNKITGIDLTQEFVDTGNIMCSWVNLDKQISLEQGSALEMPFQEGTFDCGYMMHVAMNIKDKASLFKEIFRVLRPGSAFGIYDVMRVKEGDLAYPVPWANDTNTSSLATVEQYKQAIEAAGFQVSNENNCREFALSFFNQLQEENTAKGGPAPLGIHTLMKETSSEKIKNVVDNITADLIAPVELIVKKY